jgi:tetratricopeptide (TPR) repeat protein
MKTRRLISLFMLFISLNTYADEAIFNEVDQYLSIGQNQEAADLIENYINSYPEADIIPDLIDKYIPIINNTNNVIIYLKELENTLKGYNLYYLYKKIAVIEELCGKIESAQYYFHNAALISESPEQGECYFESARLLYEIGNIDMSVIELSTVFIISANIKIVSRAFVLKGHLAKSMGDYEEAREIYELVINNYRGYPGEIEAVFSMILLIYYEYSDSDNAEKYLQYLYSIAPDSPEYKIAYNIVNKLDSNINISVTPERFFNYYKINEYTDTELVENYSNTTKEETMESHNFQDDSSDDGKIFVQTGSFVIKENAEYMVSDLSDAGFNAEILSTFINDTLYYKVVIGSFKNNEEANRELIRVKEAGFEGFLLFR